MSKYYRLDISLKTGFKYSIACLGIQLAGLKKSSESYWTEKIVTTEITSEDYQKFYQAKFEEEKKEKKQVATEDPPQKKSRKKKVDIAFSSLEDFFVGTETKKGKKK